MDDTKRFPRIEIQAEKISTSGKARFRLEGGQEGFVEEITLRHLADQNWKGLWSENAYWWTQMALVFWDVIFARVEGAGFSDQDAAFGLTRDMPMDFFTDDFYRRREEIIRERMTFLAESDIVEQIRVSHAQHDGEPCRPIERWDQFTVEELAQAAEVLPPRAYLSIMDRLLRDFNNNRRGLPDLFLWRGGDCQFVEVKGPRDKLSNEQTAWLEHLKGLGLRTAVAQIRATASGRMKSPKKKGAAKKSPSDDDLNVQVRVPAGVFWADHIKTLKSEPAKRFSLAQRNLPLPGAFREAAIALRALIRQRRQAKEEYGGLLEALYQLAAQHNFLLSTPSIDSYPSFGVAEGMPKRAWKSLDMPYSEIGYEKLELLNQTDRKRIVEAWGEPERHQHVQTLHKDVWDKYVEKWRALRKAEDERMRKEWEDLGVAFTPGGASSQPTVTVRAKKESTGCAVLLAGLVILGSAVVVSARELLLH